MQVISPNLPLLADAAGRLVPFAGNDGAATNVNAGSGQTANNDTWLAERELSLRGYDLAAIRAAVQSGTLRGRMVGSGVVVKQADLNDWLERGSVPAVASKVIPPTLRAIPGRAGSGAASEAFNTAVQAKVAAGIPKAKAVAAVVREQPGLQSQVLSEANASHAGRPVSVSLPAAQYHRPSGRRPAQTPGAAMAQFLAVVESNVARGMTRPRATSAAVRSHEGLHREAMREQRGE